MPRLALNGMYAFLLVGQLQVLLHGGGKLFFKLAAVPPVADLQIAAHVLTSDTGEHVVVAGGRVVPQVAVRQLKGLAIVVFVSGSSPSAGPSTSSVRRRLRAKR